MNNNYIIDYDAESYNSDGFQIEESSNIKILGSQINGRVFFWNTEGQVVNNRLHHVGMTDSSPLIANNYLSSDSWAVYMYGASEPVIENNIFVARAHIEVNEAGANPHIQYNAFVPATNTNGVYYAEFSDTWLGLDGMNALAECGNNFSTNPLFALGSDFHLKSQGGRWDASQSKWVFDDVTSPCVDAGNPDSVYTNEIYPNGGRINIGPYGNTPEASKCFLEFHGGQSAVLLRWLDTNDGETG